MLSELESGDVGRFYLFAQECLDLDFDIFIDIGRMREYISECFVQDEYNPERLLIFAFKKGLCSVVSHKDMMKDQLEKMIIAVVRDGNGIELPIHLRDYCVSRLRCWIDNALLAMEMRPGREYIVECNAIYPVDYKSTGVIEINKKWGDGLQQFLEMKHGLPLSPLSLITNFLSNIDFFEKYGTNIIGVSGTLGNDVEKKFMRDTFSVKFATIPTSKRRKLFELEGVILDGDYANHQIWLNALSKKVREVIASDRAVLVICEDIENADEIHENISSEKSEATLYLHTKGDGYDGGRMNKVLKPGDVVITTNLGARGTDFVTDEVVNKNGGLFVLVTFIPLNDRVEKQAFGRTGRRGATGSCQVIVKRGAMPEWSQKCETADEVKRLRNSIEIHLFNKTIEMHLMRDKQMLFREYCELKKKFVTLSVSDSSDLKIQVEILDETWAKWIQDVEARAQESNHADLMEELHRNIEDCSNQAKRFKSDNIYHIMEFGAVRLMKKDFERATKFYDLVIDMDPVWSAFAHYNRAYCTLQMKGDSYIRRANDDLETTLSKLEVIKKQPLFSEIHIIASSSPERYEPYSRKGLEMKNEVSSRLPQYYTMMECQLFHHIDTQIIETIEKLEKIDTTKGEVTTVRRRNILELIPGADCKIEQMLEEYRRLGLLFTYNIDAVPQFRYRNQIVTTHVLLESVAVTILVAFRRQILMIYHSSELNNMIHAACSIGSIGNESLRWMSRCVSRATMTGMHSLDFIPDAPLLDRIKHTESESSDEMTTETSQFANSRAKSVFELLESTKQEMHKWLDLQTHEESLHITNVVMGVLEKKIEQTIIHRVMFSEEKLHRQLLGLNDRVSSETSQYRFDLQHFVDYVRDLAQLSAHSSPLHGDNFQTAKFQNFVVELISKSRSDTAADLSSVTSEITSAAEEIEIETLITQFSDLFVNKLDDLIQITSVYQYSCDNVKLLEEANKVLTFVWSDIIRSVFQTRIIQSLMYDLQVKTTRGYLSSIDIQLPFHWVMSNTRVPRVVPPRWGPSTLTSDASLRLYNERNGLPLSFMNEHHDCNVIILDVEKEVIRQTVSTKSRTVKLIYNPPDLMHPTGHYDAYIDKKVVSITHDVHLKLFYPALLEFGGFYEESVDRVIPRRIVELLVSDYYGCQLKTWTCLTTTQYESSNWTNEPM